MKVHSSQLHLKYTQILILIVSVFSPLHLLAASDTKSEKSLDMVQGDKTGTSETRFNYFFICDGLNRAVEVQGRNYLSDNGQRRRSEITRLQTNGTVVKVGDLDSINKIIYNTEGSSILSPFVKCNVHKVTLDLNYIKFIDNKVEQSVLRVLINNDGSIKINGY